MALIKAELNRIFRMGWTYAVIIGMNAFSIIAFLIFLFLMAKTPAIEDAGAKASELKSYAGNIIYLIYMTGSGVFSFSSFFLMSLFVGITVGREFDEGSIEFFILSPYTRTRIFLVRLMGIFLTYFIARLFNTGIQLSAAWILAKSQPVFAPLINYSVLGKILAANIVADLAWIGFIVFLGMFSSGAATTVVYSLAGYFFFVVADIIVVVNEQYHFLSDWQAYLGKYTFTASCHFFIMEKIPQFLLGLTSTLPVSFDLLSVTAGYGFVFIALACVAFHYREV